jgi:tRNA threonylcarbamoyl adenosine modification protein YeaZ
VVLVIDTSSPRSALALVLEGAALAEDVVLAGRANDLPNRVLTLVEPRRLTAVAVSVGPGSFTGLRTGVSYGVGLAMGLGVPLLGIGSLDLQIARARVPAIGLVDAGRGRVYWQEPGGAPRLGAPEELPRTLPAAGWLRAEVAEAVRAAGVRLLPDEELEGFAEAAAGLAGTAERLGYDTVKLRYMQSFRPMWEQAGA